VFAGGNVAQPLRGSATPAAAAQPSQTTSPVSPESVFEKLYGSGPTPGHAISPSPAQAIPPRASGGGPPPPPRPGRAISHRPARPAPAHGSAGGPLGQRASRLSARILAAVWLGVIGWAIWVVWRFAHTQ
jgi:hypothetical protein